MTNNNSLIAKLRAEATFYQGSDGAGSSKIDFLLRVAADALARAERELTEQAATIKAMYAIVFDPISDYYGEIRVKFDALQAGTTGTEGTR